MRSSQIKIVTIGLAVVWLATFNATSACGQPAADEARTPIVGRIIIVGNTVTRDEVVRKAVGLFPGQAFRPADLRSAERRLARLGVFQCDPEKGVTPSVTPVTTENPDVVDILIQVKEAQTGTCTLGVGFNSAGRVVISLWMEERNFDPSRLPACLEDLSEGRAFRGGGRRLRIGFTLGDRH
jgi:outer membrane protein insertion porin family